MTIYKSSDYKVIASCVSILVNELTLPIIKFIKFHKLQGHLRRARKLNKKNQLLKKNLKK